MSSSEFSGIQTLVDNYIDDINKKHPGIGIGVVIGAVTPATPAGGLIFSTAQISTQGGQTITPDGTTPFFGDDDGGRLVMLDARAPNDFRPTLATGAALFSRGDYKFVAGDATEELSWLLDAKGLQNYNAIDAHPPTEPAKAFPDGGYFVMRDGWTD